jgi:hypothetical protein
MSLGRVDQIIEQAQRRIKDLAQKEIQAQELLALLSGVEREVCERGLAIQERTPLTLIPGQSVYSLGYPIYKLLGAEVPPRWKAGDGKACLKFVEGVPAWTDLKNRCIIWPHPLYAFAWKVYVDLYPIPQAVETVTIYYAALPAPTALGADPSVDAGWDPVLVEGLVARVVGDNTPLYEMKLDEKISHTVTTTTAPIETKHTTDVLGY